MKRFFAYLLLFLTLALLACWRLDTVTQTPVAQETPPPEVESPRPPSVGGNPFWHEEQGKVEQQPDGSFLITLPRRTLLPGKE